MCNMSTGFYFLGWVYRLRFACFGHAATRLFVHDDHYQYSLYYAIALQSDSSLRNTIAIIFTFSPMDEFYTRFRWPII